MIPLCQDVLNTTLSYLDIVSIVRLSATSKHMLRICRSDVIWKAKVVGSYQEERYQRDNLPWYDLYVKLHWSRSHCKHYILDSSECDGEAAVKGMPHLKDMRRGDCIDVIRKGRTETARYVYTGTRFAPLNEKPPLDLFVITEFPLRYWANMMEDSHHVAIDMDLFVNEIINNAEVEAFIHTLKDAATFVLTSHFVHDHLRYLVVIRSGVYVDGFREDKMDWRKLITEANYSPPIWMNKRAEYTIEALLWKAARRYLR